VLSDNEIVRLVRAGGESGRQAFATFYERYYRPAHIMAGRQTKAEAYLVDDLVAEAFLGVLQRMRDPNGIKAFEARNRPGLKYLNRSTTNGYISYLRHHEQSRTYRSGDLSSGELAPRALMVFDQEPPSIQLEGFKELTDAYQGLSENEAQAIWLSFYLGLDAQEAARQANTTSSGYKSRKHGALAKLRRMLSQADSKEVA